MNVKLAILLTCVLFGVASAGVKAVKDAELLEPTSEKDSDLKTASSYGYGYALGYPTYHYASYYPYYGHSYGYGYGGYYPHFGHSYGYGWPGDFYWR